MRELVRSQLGHYTDRVGSQIVLTGEPLQTSARCRAHIGMAMHELAQMPLNTGTVHASRDGPNLLEYDAGRRRHTDVQSVLGESAVRRLSGLRAAGSGVSS